MAQASCSDRANSSDHQLLAAQVCCVSRTREGNRHAARSRALWPSGLLLFNIECRLVLSFKLGCMAISESS
jgi:hypothetical protein